MEETVIDRMYAEFRDLLVFLNEQGEPSFRNTAEENFRKALLLAAASYFERRICDDILVFFGEVTNTNLLVTEFTRNQAISRKYHSFFNWDVANANKFFSLFGRAFSNHMQQEARTNREFDAAIKAFMEIGQERNRMVHEDFGSYALQKTAEEVYMTYKSALLFIEVTARKLRDFRAENESA